MDITSASIATIISSSVASSLAIYFNRNNNVKALNDQLDNILKISIQHPYLESESFVKTWKENRKSTEEEYLRYELYCTLLFNFLERFCRYYKCNETKIQNRLNVKEWVRHHKDYWLNPPSDFENIDGYSKDFRKLIHGFLTT